MSQNDFVVANQAFPATRSDLNSALQALASLSSGASAPPTTYPYMWWADTANTLLKMRNAADSAWITIGTLDATNLGLLSLAGGSLTGAINFVKGSDIASATTTDIGAATGNVVDVTGTTTITGLGTVQAGTTRIVRFTGALTFTHNATSLILPGAANITTASGDVAVMVSLGSGNWYCANYMRASGKPIAPYYAVASQSEMEAATSNTVVVTPGTFKYHPGATKGRARIYHSSGTPTLLESDNISSLTDIGVGQITVNHTSAFSTANYAMPASGVTASSVYYLPILTAGTPPSTSSVDIHIYAVAIGLQDIPSPGISLSFLGDF